MKAKYLYLARKVGTSHFKVGVAVNPATRCTHVRHVAGAPVRVVCAFPTLDAFAVEHHAHKALRQYHLGGEWFDISAADLRSVAWTLRNWTESPDEAARLLTRPRLSQAERLARRIEMGAAVHAGEDPKDVATRYGVTVLTVERGCAEAGIVMPRPKRPDPAPASPSTFAVLAALMQTDDTQSAIAERFRVSPEWVRAIYKRAREAGIPVHGRQRGRPLKIAA